ncbi:MAG: DNA repair protein RecN [uncultured Sulfurovum sp.]|uniref:DNA repair protein RecN n=1 Tax=uncultured Sulfurovum sp. TaxID=269237 RepID=A0A6S6SLH2_9BACT|nr:MAG: DNA repair protein RecN [uncultured Sulfurovum sp.]
MINRVYLKNLISFSEVEIELKKGLVVLSGPSGAGKSLFMNSILSTFGYGTAEATLCEVLVTKPKNMHSEVFELEDEITLKTIKKEKVRYSIDGQNVSKKVLNGMFSPFVQFLSVRDKSGFESTDLLKLIDNELLAKDKGFKKLLKEYQKRYAHYKAKLTQLEKIKADEAKILELIEFTEFEIEKIESVKPVIGEDIELLKVKHQLSRIDKINDAIENANGIFTFEESVTEVYRLLDKDDAIFSEMMNQLRADFEDIESLSEELAEVDIEAVLDRLEKISSLKNRYGSIEEAIEYVEIKKRELAGYENIEQDKSMLISFLNMEFSELSTLAGQISFARKEKALMLEKPLKKYLAELKLPALEFVFNSKGLENSGQDSVDVNMNGSTANKLSGGEFNRVRLALMVVALSGVKESGVLILDEIDANVSGDESIAIANMIAKLSEVYQIFAISHQAHLASKAKQHLLVSKSKNESKVTLLDRKGQISEIARIIGGEKPNAEAISFSEKLLSLT